MYTAKNNKLTLLKEHLKQADEFRCNGDLCGHNLSQWQPAMSALITETKQTTLKFMAKILTLYVLVSCYDLYDEAVCLDKLLWLVLITVP